MSRASRLCCQKPQRRYQDPSCLLQSSFRDGYTVRYCSHLCDVVLTEEVFRSTPLRTFVVVSKTITLGASEGLLAQREQVASLLCSRTVSPKFFLNARDVRTAFRTADKDVRSGRHRGAEGWLHICLREVIVKMYR